LKAQVKKYIRGLKKQLDLVNRGSEPIQAICILGQKPSDFKDIDESYINRVVEASRIEGISFVTYQQLIHDSYETYKKYLDASSQQGRILQLLHNIDTELSQDED
jgi:hypothetical protein